MEQFWVAGRLGDLAAAPRGGLVLAGGLFLFVTEKEPPIPIIENFPGKPVISAHV